MINQRIRLALLSFWLGIMVFFSFIIAPVAFAVLPTPRLAGEVVSRSLAVTEIIGMVMGGLLVLDHLRRRRARMEERHLDLAILIGMTLMMAVSRFFVSSRLHAIRLEYGDRLADLLPTDPVKSTFGFLHQVSVWLMGLVMIGALCLIIRLVRARQ